MQQAETDFRKQFATPDEFNAFFQSEFHGSEQLLQEKIRRSLLIEAFLKTEVENKEHGFSGRSQGLLRQTPGSLRTSGIVYLPDHFRSPPGQGHRGPVEGRRARAPRRRCARRKRQRTTEEFGLLAEKISDDDYRVMMGQHKPIPVDSACASGG